MSRFTHLRSLQGTSVTLNPPRRDAGSSPINHSAKCLSFFQSSIAIKKPIICILREDKPYLQCGEGNELQQPSISEYLQFICVDK